MQTLKLEHSEIAKAITPERRAQNRERSLLTFVIKATARDQEKNILISKLQREVSEAADDLDALRAEVKLKDKILHAKEDELLILKTENEKMKQFMKEIESGRAKAIENKHTVDERKSKLSNGIDHKTPAKSVASLKVGVENAVFRTPSPIIPMISRRRSIKRAKEAAQHNNNLGDGNEKRSELTRAKSMIAGKSPLKSVVGLTVNENGVAARSPSPLAPNLTRKRSIKKTKEAPKESTGGGVTGIFYNLRKKTKK